MKEIEQVDHYVIFPAIFVTAKEDIKRSIFQIQEDLVSQIEYFNEIGKTLESRRLKNRVDRFGNDKRVGILFWNRKLLECILTTEILDRPLFIGLFS